MEPSFCSIACLCFDRHLPSSHPCIAVAMSFPSPPPPLDPMPQSDLAQKAEHEDAFSPEHPTAGDPGLYDDIHQEAKGLTRHSLLSQRIQIHLS